MYSLEYIEDFSGPGTTQMVGVVRRSRRGNVRQAPSRLRKNTVARRNFTELHILDARSTPRRMLKKAVQQGHSERRGEEVQTALRVGRSPLQWVLANGKAPTVLPTSEKLLLNVEPLSAARTPLAVFFSILLDHVSEVFDRATEGILELHLRFPFQESTRPRDIGPSDFGIIGRQGVMSDLAR